jgi:hypothetical protein
VVRTLAVAAYSFDALGRSGFSSTFGEVSMEGDSLLQTQGRTRTCVESPYIFCKSSFLELARIEPYACGRELSHRVSVFHQHFIDHATLEPGNVESDSWAG